jgi:Opy2 protein
MAIGKINPPLLARMLSNSRLDVEGHLRTIFRRCVQCPPGPPSCPTCPSDETCSLKAESCTECASTTCVKIGSLPGQGTPQNTTPVGAIAGGVVGGVVVIFAITYLFYRSCLRSKRREQAWIDQKVEKRDQTTLHRADRQSTRSVGSIASTVLSRASRASNVIQIAYIPGIINRTPPDSPSLIVPPVPPLPFGSANMPHIDQDMHFFMPGDLRDSTYSNMTTEDQRISLAPSLVRASVATTIYRHNAVVSTEPAQQVYRTRPAVVSVRSGSTTSTPSETHHNHTPPMPQVPMNIANSSIVARSVTARPIEVKKAKSGTRVPTLANLAQASSSAQQSTTPSAKSDDAKNYWEEKEVVVSPSTTIQDTPVSPLVQPKSSFATFHSASSSPISTVQGGSSPLSEVSPHHADGGLNAMIEVAMSRAAREPTHMGLGGRPDIRKEDSSPFSDANEVKENVLG